MSSRIKRYGRATINFLLFSNVFIAVCALAQALVTYNLLGMRPDKSILAFLFFSTLAQYNFSILLSKPAQPQKSPFRRVKWIFGHYRIMITISIISGLSLLPLWLFLDTPAKILTFFLAVASIAYALPIFSFGNKRFGLRNIPGIKLFLIALVWSLSTVLLPILQLESSENVLIFGGDTVLLISKRFLLVAAITIPFDIRDLFQDRSSALKTIPVMLGEQKANVFCQALLIAYLVLLFIFSKNFDKNFFALSFTILLSGWLIFKSNLEKNEYYYFFYLDGILILQFLMLQIFSFLPTLSRA